MLLTVGEKGYVKATVREVSERSRITQDTFYRRFGSKDACFARAYEETADRLASQVLGACREAPSWREGFRAGLAELLRVVAEQPLLAKALLIEVRRRAMTPGGCIRKSSGASPRRSTAPATSLAPDPTPVR